MEDISGFTKAALDTLSANEEKMKIAMFDIQKYFLGLIDNHNVIGSGRVKSNNSLREKILRKSYHVKYDSGADLISSLDDIIGVRIICLLHNEEESTWKKIASKLKEIELGKIKYYVNDEETIFLEKIKLPVPQKNEHDIYKIHGYYLLDKERYNFELQIKSLVHMLWGEIEHLLFYKNYEYIIDNSFYSSVMDSMYRNLMNIDSQLKDITNQMRGKNDLVMFDELKRMLAKILYEKVNPAIESLLGCMIDLRECYDSVIEVVLHLSYYYSYQECLEHVQEVVAKINSIDIESLKTDIPYYEYTDRFSRDERIKNLSKIISKRSKENVYYRLFVFLVGDMRDKRGAKDIIETVTEYYLKILRYEDDLEDDEINTIRERLISSVVDNFIFEIVTNYDFYWIINNNSYLMQMIRSVMSIVRGIDLDESDDITKVSVLMKDILIMNILIDKNKNVSEQLLQEIYDMSENDVWNKEEFRNEEFCEIIKNYKLNEGESRKKLKEILSAKEVGLCMEVI